MSAPARGALFALVLALVFAVASLAGAAIDPSVDDEPEPTHDEGAEMEAHTQESGLDVARHESGTDAALPGLSSASGGYRLIPEQTRFEAGGPAELGFRVVDSGGEVVHEFDTEHERKMHLILVRRDFANFQHLHPRQREDGTWAAEADLSEAGIYRAFADFSVEGQSLTLGADLFVSGSFRAGPLPAPSPVADAGGGYEVEIEAKTATPSVASPVQFSVSKNGRRLDVVEPYLGADGHLVALREHDQAFLHTHPRGEAGGAGPITFAVEYPTPGRYRLYLQFKHGNRVRTAAFTQQVSAGDLSMGEAGSHGTPEHAHEEEGNETG